MCGETDWSVVCTRESASAEAQPQGCNYQTLLLARLQTPHASPNLRRRLRYRALAAPLAC